MKEKGAIDEAAALEDDKAAELRIMYEAGKQLAGTLEINRIYDVLQQLVSQVMSCKNLVVSSYDPDSNEIRCEFAVVDGAHPDLSLFPPVHLDKTGKGMQSAVIVNGESVLFNDVADRVVTPGTKYVDVGKKGVAKPIKKAEDTEVRSVMMVPMKLEGRTFGVVSVMSHEVNAYTPSHLRILEGVVQQLSAATQNARLYQQTLKAESRYKSLVDAMTPTAWETNAIGEFTTPQHSWEKLTGQPWEGHKGRGWVRAVHPHDVSVVTRGWLLGLKKRTPQVCEARIWSQEHKEFRHTITRAVPILGADGRVTEWVGAITDIHDRKVMEDRSRYLLALNDRLRDLSNADEIIQSVLSGLAEQFRASDCSYTQINKEDRVGVNYRIVDGALEKESRTMGQDELKWVMPMTREVWAVADTELDDRTTQHRQSVNIPTGTSSMLSIPMSRKGSSSGFISIFDSGVREWSKEEIELAQETAHRAWQAIQTVEKDSEIKELNAALEQRVAERTAELEAATKEMEGFTYTVSHDLRGPLRAIMSSSMILIEDYGDKMQGEERRLLERQATAARKLGQIIDDVLKLSRLSRAELNKTTVDFTALANEVAMELQPRDPAQRFEIKVEEGLTTTGDSQLLRLALQNLIENSVKFSKPNSVPHLQIGATRNAEQEVIFVRDDGIGFDQQYMQKIFAPFERLHRDEEYPGTGIGLANVKRIIERHGGRIWAEGRVGEGATFFFTL